MRILVTGSREFTDLEMIRTALRRSGAELLSGPPTVVHGANPRGADRIAEAVAKVDLGWETDPHPANWEQFGKSAGHIRNQEMVDLAPDVCLGFFKKGAANKGTRDCVTRALRAGIPIRTYWA